MSSCGRLDAEAVAVSAPNVLRVIARVIEALPEVVGNLACGGITLLLFGGCTVVVTRADPVYA